MSEDAVVIQNLKDAGCDEVLITNYLKLKAKGNIEEQLRLLAYHRCNLMTVLQEHRLLGLSYLSYQKNISAETNQGELP